MAEPIMQASELILNQDGSIYHLNLQPEDIADTIITVGDPDRVERVSRYFDKIDIVRQKREFVTHTGWLGNKRLTVISTGIGVDNIDIVLTELDALANIDFAKRQQKTNLRSLEIIRLGTCGGLQADIGVDEVVVSGAALGLDNLMDYYHYELTESEGALSDAINAAFCDPLLRPYGFFADSDLLTKLSQNKYHVGITTTCSGFYGPQGRQLRAKPRDPNLLNQLQRFEFQDWRVLNFEMETSGILGLSRLLGHRSASVSVIIANRATGEFSSKADVAVDSMIQQTLASLV